MSPQPGVRYNGEDEQRSDREFEPIGFDMGQDKSIVDDADEQRADKRAKHRAYAAIE